MLLKKKIVEKSVFKSNKEEKNKNYTSRLIIHLFMAVFQTQIKIYSFALETFSVIFFIQKEIVVCCLFASSEGNPQYSCKFQNCFKRTYRPSLNTCYCFTLCMPILCLNTHPVYRNQAFKKFVKLKSEIVQSANSSLTQKLLFECNFLN